VKNKIIFHFTLSVRALADAAIAAI